MATDEERINNLKSAYGNTIEEEKEELKSKLDEHGWVLGYPFAEPYDQRLRTYFSHRVLVILHGIIPKEWKYYNSIFKSPNYIVRGIESKLNDIPGFNNSCDIYLTEQNALQLADNIYETFSKTLIAIYENPRAKKSKDIRKALDEYDTGYYYDMGAYPTEVLFQRYIPREKWEWD